VAGLPICLKREELRVQARQLSQGIPSCARSIPYPTRSRAWTLGGRRVGLAHDAGVVAAAAGGPPDLGEITAVMRRHGLTPAQPVAG
jgi:hypothetical protein